MKIAITPGMGIGPEILARLLENCHPGLDPGSSNVVPILDSRFRGNDKIYRVIQSSDPVRDLLEAIELAKNGEVQALVTGPVRKSILQNIHGKSYPGQTELLQEHLSVDGEPALMAFVGGPFVMGLATVHVPITQVAALLSQKMLTQKLERLIQGTAKLFNKPEKQVRVTVLGLNPHAGEGGLLGHEEQDIISPVVKQFEQRGFEIRGPVAADGFFGWGVLQDFEGVDAVLAMMHDQGLGPYKILGQGAIANVTFGLKVLRASPAHGTADDLVGTGKASIESFKKALEITS